MRLTRNCCTIRRCSGTPNPARHLCITAPSSCGSCLPGEKRGHHLIRNGALGFQLPGVLVSYCQPLDQPRLSPESRRDRARRCRRCRSRGRRTTLSRIPGKQHAPGHVSVILDAEDNTVGFGQRVQPTLQGLCGIILQMWWCLGVGGTYRLHRSRTDSSERRPPFVNAWIGSDSFSNTSGLPLTSRHNPSAMHPFSPKTGLHFQIRVQHWHEPNDRPRGRGLTLCLRPTLTTHSNEDEKMHKGTGPRWPQHIWCILALSSV